MAFTFTLLDTYAGLVEKHHADIDLDAIDRAEVTRLLRAAVAAAPTTRGQAIVAVDEATLGSTSPTALARTLDIIKNV